MKKIILAKKEERGITLIALIITIIILLILATVAVDVAIDDGLFTKAQEAVNKTNNKVENTQNRVDELTEILDNLEKPKIGDYVNYEPEIGTYEVTTDKSGHTELQTFTTQTGEDSLKWRIMSLGDEDGNILLVADRVTTDKIILKGGKGASYGPGAIDGFCSTLYDNGALGATARSYNYYSQVLVNVSSLGSYVEGGDRFPYLGAQTFWLPVSYYEDLGTAAWLEYNMYFEERFGNSSCLACELSIASSYYLTRC